MSQKKCQHMMTPDLMLVNPRGRGGGGDSHHKRSGLLVGLFELSIQGDQSGSFSSSPHPPQTDTTLFFIISPRTALKDTLTAKNIGSFGEHPTWDQHPSTTSFYLRSVVNEFFLSLYTLKPVFEIDVSVQFKETLSIDISNLRVCLDIILSVIFLFI